MRNFSICMEKKEDVTKVLGNLLIMDIHHGTDYTCTISGNKDLEKFINSFPYSFKGTIKVLHELENNDNFYNLINRKVNLIRHAINEHGNTIQNTVITYNPCSKMLFKKKRTKIKKIMRRFNVAVVKR